MVLRPLEYSECVTDSPFFRETLLAHEKELENTAESIKVLVKACKRLLAAQKELSKAQRQVSEILGGFKIELIGDSTEDEVQIIGAFKEFSSLINLVEDQRDMFLDQAEHRLLNPLESFRHDEVQATKEERKAFERSSTNYCKSLEAYLSVSSKRKDSQLQEADDQMALESEQFLQHSCGYVQRLQGVQLRKTFDLVEPLLGFMRDQMTFYHQGYDVCNDFSGNFQHLQMKLQIAREQYEQQTEQTTELIGRVIERAKAGDTSQGTLARQGYCYLHKSRIGGLGYQSIKHYCQFLKDDGLFVMFPYNQQQGKLSNPESFKLDSCTRRPTDSIEKRFCFDVTSGDKVYTLQGLNAKDRTLWMEVLDGREPDYMMIDSMKSRSGDKGTGILAPATQVQFIEKCIAAVEAKGMDEEGVYRLSGVASKSEKLMKQCIEKGKVSEKVNLMDSEWEVKTITSTLKNFFRNREALLTFKLYPDFLAAAKEISPNDRFRAVHRCVTILPPFNQKVLSMLMRHLNRVSKCAAVNKMHASNIGVVFGPTLMRPQEESVAGIMDIKYQNIVIEMMVERCDEMFSDQPQTPTSPTGTLTHSGSSNTLTHPTLRRAAPTAPSHPAPLPPAHAAPAAPSHAAPSAPPHSAPTVPSHTAPTVPAHPAPVAPPQTASATPTGAPPAPPAAASSSSVTAAPRRPPPSRKPTEMELRARAASEVIRPATKPPPPPPSSRQASAVSVLSKAQPSGIANGPNGSSPEQASRPVAPVAPQPRRRPGSITERDQLPHSASFGSPEQLTSPQGPPSGKQAKDTPNSSSPPAAPPRRGRAATSGGGRRARALYPCLAEDENELSFSVDDVLHDVVPSDEPGWYVCSLRGQTGLVPENYIELL